MSITLVSGHFTYTESLNQDKIISIIRGRGGGEKKEKQEKENTLKIIYLPHFKEYQSLMHLHYGESTNSEDLFTKYVLQF